MTDKVIYRSEPKTIDIANRTNQFFEIEQVFGKTKGKREFKFRNLYQVHNGTTFENVHNINVCHLKSLLEVLKKMDADGFLDNEEVIV